ncbi:MAG: MerR family transcriptional regulator [Alphaproteobacteria bacterium]|nr:MerR family transcriptional regulator [Alphaproteobacteria bacterium]
MTETKPTPQTTSTFQSIAQVAADLGVEPHVLRFWETKFTEIAPHKHTGGRRLYRADDIALVRGIHHLLYGQGLTIKGAQKVLADNGTAYIRNMGANITKGKAPTLVSMANAAAPVAHDALLNGANKRTLEDIREKLTQAHALLTANPDNTAPDTD